MSLMGLTEQQVAEKIKQGKVNQTSDAAKNTIGKIILKNTLTIFNLVNLILALMIISVGAYKNLLFLFAAIANTLISIINGIRAKLTVDKMRLVSEQHPTVIRNGKSIQIPPDQIVEGDLIVFALGDQIMIDAEIKEGNVEVNESFITGEQDNIKKRPGDKLISGSFIVSGTCKAIVTAVGDENFINKLEKNARVIKTADSKLFRLINNIVKYISFALIPIGILLLWARFRVPDTTPEVAVTSTVAALISMIPEGLVLLTSSVLALATIKLSRKKVLVQDLYSIETLARVDTICLDKTGTLTTGKMTVKDIVPAAGVQKNALENALKLILSASDTDNATSAALKQKFLKKPNFKPTEQIVENIPFSSDRKYSGVVTDKATYLLGAPEIILPEETLSALPSSSHYRMLAIMRGDKFLGYVLLEDELRADASEIIRYFYDNDVDIRIISGDNLSTVQNIATSVGVKDTTGTDLSKQDKDINYDKLVKEYNIFTRVTPSQKKSLVKALKRQGRTVAMTGDGVNDILAMKEADCSIAIGDGSDAARKAAKLVLLNSDFAAVPSIIDEGRQSINNLERSATLFLSKNVYAAILAIFFILIPLEYPYAPLEMSLLNFTCIGFPGVILALEKNTARIKNKFASNILQFSVPIGLTVAIAMLALSIVASSLGYARAELVTTSAIVTFAIDFVLIYGISKPVNLLRGSLMSLILTVFLAALFVPYSRNFLDFTLLSLDKALVCAALIISSIVIFFLFKRLMHRFLPKLLKNPKFQI